MAAIDAFQVTTARKQKLFFIAGREADNAAHQDDEDVIQPVTGLIEDGHDRAPR